MQGSGRKVQGKGQRRCWRLEAKRQSGQVCTASNLKRGQAGRALLQPDAEPAPCGLCSRAGFTLLEVLVAVAILAIAMVAILKANVQNLDGLTKSRETTTASLLAASKLAEIEAVGVANWGESQGDFGEDYPKFTWQVETASTEVEGLERIAVIVQRSGGVAGREVIIEEFMLVEE